MIGCLLRSFWAARSKMLCSSTESHLKKRNSAKKQRVEQIWEKLKWNMSLPNRYPFWTNEWHFRRWDMSCLVQSSTPSEEIHHEWFTSGLHGFHDRLRHRVRWQPMIRPSSGTRSNGRPSEVQKPSGYHVWCVLERPIFQEILEYLQGRERVAVAYRPRMSAGPCHFFFEDFVREAWEEDDPTRRPSAISVLAKRPFGGGHPRVANASRGESRWEDTSETGKAGEGWSLRWIKFCWLCDAVICLWIGDKLHLFFRPWYVFPGLRLAQRGHRQEEEPNPRKRLWLRELAAPRNRLWSMTRWIWSPGHPRDPKVRRQGELEMLKICGALMKRGACWWKLLESCSSCVMLIQDEHTSI